MLPIFRTDFKTNDIFFYISDTKCISKTNNASSDYGQINNGKMAKGHLDSNTQENIHINNIDDIENKKIYNKNQNLNNLPDKLDLADLDLSQLRLTKKDLETLSTITPELPKHFQDQLMAQLPPEQARKLSRTLSMQSTTKPNGNGTRFYKRSVSGGSRDGDNSTFIETPTYNNATDRVKSRGNENENVSSSSICEDACSKSISPLGFDRSSVIRRSLSRSRNTPTTKLAEANNRFSYSGDMKTCDQTAMNRYGFSEYPNHSGSSRPPPSGGCLSPPPTDMSDSPSRRRSVRRISRFLRPDFFDQPPGIDDNYLLREKRERERETQSVLREIRERSRERSRDRGYRERGSESSYPDNNISTVDTSSSGYNKTPDYRISSTIREKRKSSIPDIRTTVAESTGISKNYHTRCKSVDLCQDNVDTSVKNIADTDSILEDLVKQSQKKSLDIPNEKKEISEVIPTKTNGIAKKVKAKATDGKETKKKLKAVATSVVVEPPILTANINNIEMVTQLNNEIDSVTLPLPLQMANKNASKLLRPKSYPSKELATAEKVLKKSAPENREKSISVEKEVLIKKPTVKITASASIAAGATEIPTSHSKTNIKTSTGVSTLTSTRNSITGVVEKLIEKGSERLSPSKGMVVPKPKKVKVVKKIAKPTEVAQEASSNIGGVEVKEKSPEKKPRGFLYSIGQKFEKMREGTKSKEKKSTKATEATVLAKEDSIPIAVPENDIRVSPINISNTDDTKNIPGAPSTSAAVVPAAKSEQRKTKIDAMIRNLRERSLTHTAAAEVREGSAPPTESGLIKRAVSVEDLSNGMTSFNKCNVNKVLGMFIRIEKEQTQQKAQEYLENVRSTSAITVLGNEKERPRSSGFVSKLKKGRPYYTGAKSDTKFEKNMISAKLNEELGVSPSCKIPHSNINGCNVVKKYSPECCETRVNDNANDTNDDSFLNASRDIQRTFSMDPSLSCEGATMRSSSASAAARERIRNNRKGLVLDINNAHFNNSFENKLNNNSNVGNKINNNTINHSHEHGNNQEDCYNDRGFDNKNVCPSYDISTNYSSDSRSQHDDGASSSTFLSPTEEPDMYDDWSVYSGKLF